MGRLGVNKKKSIKWGCVVLRSRNIGSIMVCVRGAYEHALIASTQKSMGDKNGIVFV